MTRVVRSTLGSAQVSHIASATAAFQFQSSVTGLKFKCRFPLLWARYYLLFTSSYIHIPRMARGVCGWFDCEKGSSSRRIKGSSFMHMENDKAGWVTTAVSSQGSAMAEMEAALFLSPLVSLHLLEPVRYWPGLGEGEGLAATLRGHLGHSVPLLSPLWYSTPILPFIFPNEDPCPHCRPTRQLCHGRIASPHLSCYVT